MSLHKDQQSLIQHPCAANQRKDVEFTPASCFNIIEP